MLENWPSLYWRRADLQDRHHGAGAAGPRRRRLRRLPRLREDRRRARHLQGQLRAGRRRRHGLRRRWTRTARSATPSARTATAGPARSAGRPAPPATGTTARSAPSPSPTAAAPATPGSSGTRSTTSACSGAARRPAAAGTARRTAPSSTEMPGRVPRRGLLRVQPGLPGRDAGRGRVVHEGELRPYRRDAAARLPGGPGEGRGALLPAVQGQPKYKGVDPMCWET